MILTIITILTSLLIFLDYLNKKKRNDIAAGIPGPTQIPIFGSLFVFSAISATAAVNLMKEHCKQFNGFSRAWVFNRLILTIARPEYIEPILSSSKHINKNSMYDLLGGWLGDGLLLSGGSKWRSRRKIITPAFHFKILEHFVDIFDEQSAILVEKLKKHSGTGKEFDVMSYITLATLDVICETAMGVNVNAQTDSECQYVQGVSDVSKIVMLRFGNNFYRSELIFKLFAPTEYKRYKEALRELHSFADNVICQRRAELEKNMHQINSKENQTDEKEIGIKKKMMFLDILLQSSIDGRPLTNSELREEVDTFMFAGHDTSASGISFALHLISRHPDVQQKMFEEITQVIGHDKDKPTSYHDLQELKYLERVIKEALRLYPSVSFIGRELLEDTAIETHRIPAGTEIIVPVFVMMRDPKYFPDPDKFEPDRYISENTGEKQNVYAHVPFSAGPRNCIGQKFALLEMKNMISKILRHYELLPLGEAPNPVVDIILKSTNGVQIGLKQRVH